MSAIEPQCLIPTPAAHASQSAWWRYCLCRSASASPRLRCSAVKVHLSPSLDCPLAVVGLLDDRHNLPATLRYGVQLLTAAVVLGLSPLVQPVGLSVASGSWLLVAALGFLLIAVTAVINFTNFMDGLDGLVAGCMTVTIAALTTDLMAPWSLWALVGSLLGFLIWNWSPAKVFMGDVGSTFLGVVFAGLVLQASSWTQAFGYLLVATPLLGDACLCVPRRWLAGQRVFQAHRLHLFQRLHQAGWSHARVALTYLRLLCWQWPCWEAGLGCSVGSRCAVVRGLVRPTGRGALFCGVQELMGSFSRKVAVRLSPHRRLLLALMRSSCQWRCG